MKTDNTNRALQTGDNWRVVFYAMTVFSGAFLLFQVQPLFGKFVLPWFGGSGQVWTTCMLFFQLVLLAGYAYAHFSISYFRPRTQAVVHMVLLAAAVAALPIVPRLDLKPQPGGDPILQILLICTLCLGLPYFVLSTTGPLMQAWLSRTNSSKSPYRLYALSNAASLLALMSFPFIFEPAFSRQTLAQIWSWGFTVFVFFCGLCAVWLFRHPTSIVRQGRADTKQNDAIAVPALTRWLWVALPAAASVELLAVTNKICLDVAVIPFLWVLPLSLYLLSFIICFDHEKWYVRPVFVSLFILGIIGVIIARTYEEHFGIRTLIFLYSAMLFTCCMVCHGELYHLRPKPRRLTAYYLSIASGGAIGGVLVAVVAPLVFNTYHELHLGLLACVLFLLMADKSEKLINSKRKNVWIILILIVGVASIFLKGKRTTMNQTAIENKRNFFGVLTIYEENRGDEANHKYLMQHGTTFHGLQFASGTKRLRPTAYYSRRSGIGYAMQFLPKRQNRRIGIVGLGVGTIAIYAGESDYVRFYEINPQVVELAKKHFTYLQSSKGEIDIVMGDGRLSMDAEEGNDFDVLAIDAFSSDSVPVHLLTKEAFEVYLKHINDDGIIAIHVSTVHLDLLPVIWKLAEYFKLPGVWIESYEDKESGALSSDWILLTNNTEFLNQKVIQQVKSPPNRDFTGIDLWTDDHVNLFQILK